LNELKPAPFANLTPSSVLDFLAATGFAVSGQLLQLNSYENRVFQAGLDDGTFVVAKFYRAERWSHDQILEEHAFSLELAAQEVPIAAPLTLRLCANTPEECIALHGTPPTLAIKEDLRMAVYPRKGGRNAELDRVGTLQRIGYFLGRLHAVGQKRLFKQRLTHQNVVPGQQAREWLATPGRIPEALAPQWLQAADLAIESCAALFERVGPIDSIRLHGDFHPGNLLWAGGPYFVDLDDACNGAAIQDFWMLLDGDPQHMQTQLLEILEGYETFRNFDWREWRLVEAFRTLRMLHYSAWISQRWADPAFPAAFPWFGDHAYWTAQSAMLREQVDLLQKTLSSPSPF
jgi:Ser/Thr protein kinase RdoA (MazF antagonist)